MKATSMFVSFAAALAFVLAHGAAQTTAFTYQGHLLQNGAPTNGNHDMVFTLWDSVSGGAQVGSTITQTGYPVANGVFSIDLDFGASVFTGAQRYLDVKIDGNELTPRQPINSAPFAVYALSAANGMSVSGSTSGNQFTNDHLYTGISLIGQNLPMVMTAAPAFNPAGTSTQKGYTGAVDVYSHTSQVQNTFSFSGAGSGKATTGDVRVLAALDPAYKDMAMKLFAGGHYDNLQIDVLATPNGAKPYVAQSYCYGIVFVTSLQPLPQTNTYEISLMAGQIGVRIAQLNGDGSVSGYAETGWNLVTNASLGVAPCVTPIP